MNTRGFTLTELLIVIAVIGILSAIATMEFNKMMRKSGVEAQMRTIYSDLMAIRTEAVHQRRQRAVIFTASRYEIYSSVATTGVGARTVKDLRYPLLSNTTISNKIIFTEQGLLDDPNNGNRSICVQEDTGAAVDSIVLSTTRIQLGRWDVPGGLASDCRANRITNQ